MLPLIWALSVKDIKQRYQQRYLRIAWAVINPIFHTLISTLIFFKVIRLDSEGIPYPLFVYCGILLWGFFSSCVMAATSSLVSNRTLVTKLPLPRIAIPLSCVLTSGVDFVIGVLIFIAGLVYYQIPLSRWALLTPVVFGLLLFLAVGIGLILSVVNVYVRDVSNAIPILLRAGFALSPVLYSAETLRNKWNWLYELNPVAVVIDASRKILLHGTAPDTDSLLVASVVSLAFLVLGIFCFKKLERNIADFI